MNARKIVHHGFVVIFLSQFSSSKPGKTEIKSALFIDPVCYTQAIFILIAYVFPIFIVNISSS